MSTFLFVSIALHLVLMIRNGECFDANDNGDVFIFNNDTATVYEIKNRFKVRKFIDFLSRTGRRVGRWVFLFYCKNYTYFIRVSNVTLFKRQI